MPSSSSCRICQGSRLELFYQGPIRVGKFGNLSRDPQEVTECTDCGARALAFSGESLAKYYESEAYRAEVDGDSDPSTYFKSHDAEQVRHLQQAGIESFRDRVVADVGCGAGSFLDSVRGLVKEAIAIEPSEPFRRSLENRGYSTFAYSDRAREKYEARLDIATSFSVLEHVEDPLSFLKEIRALLKPGSGQAIVSTPNANDVLLSALPSHYPQFFYRKAHLWYFTPTALENLFKKAGFREVKISYFQRFGLGNFLNWVSERAPRGQASVPYVTPAMDAVWKAELERTRQCDYLFVKALA